VGSVIAPLLDVAVVSVQMRGSGCSGGAFDLFDLPTTYDGYDAIETPAGLQRPDPRPTHRREDARPLPRGRFTELRVPIFPVDPAFRAGSRIRVTVQAPSGDRPRWSLATLERGRTRNTIAVSGERPSLLGLPVLPG